MREYIVRKNGGNYGHVYSWRDLAPLLGLTTNMLSYSKIDRNNLQKRVPVRKDNGKIRWTYKSLSPLSKVQLRIGQVVSDMFDGLEGTECAIAYRKGVRYYDVIKNIPQAKCLIQYDIRGYFDHVTLDHIVDALKKQGVPHNGATMIGLYCTVYAGGGVQTLQQGSAASPAVSNLVGHYVFDLPIQQWLKDNYPDLDCTYIRFCDNLALFVHGDQEEGFYPAFRKFCEESCATNGFETQKWHCITDDNPAIHQRFLGMILNSTPRVDKRMLRKVRAQMFNWALNGIGVESRRKLTQGMITASRITASDLIEAHYKRQLVGTINYISNINADHGLMLKKLLMCAKYLDEAFRYSSRTVKYKSDIFEAIKTYKNRDESLETFMERVTGTRHRS